MKYSETTVVIPTLNEEKNIGQLIEVLKNLYPGIKIIVTDDGSQDQTRQIARGHGAFVLDRTKQKIKGITAAVVHALQFVKTKNLVVIDADFQHPPEKIKEIIEKLEKSPVVIGARLSVPKQWGFIRKLQSRVAEILCQIRLGRKIKDPVAGFFGIHAELFQKTNKKNFEMKCFKVLFNILKNQRKVKISYIYYDFNLRKGGQSKISKKHIYYFLRNLVK